MFVIEFFLMCIFGNGRHNNMYLYIYGNGRRARALNEYFGCGQEDDRVYVYVYGVNMVAVH